MKLIKLSIHNIASIEDAVIDFDNGPLADDSRFLICGPTGAGKTTLLDALCLALYGTTPRLHSTRSETYVDRFDNFVLPNKREDIKIADPRMLMRRGCLSCWVELIFTDKDDQLLKSVWSCSRAHNKITGSIKASEWVLMDAKEDSVICSKKSEVEKMIEERIGMSFEQFCRTTMLAQGDFTKFLKSQDNEKSEILEKLTGTELFSVIGSRIYQRKMEKEQTLKQIKSRLEGVQLLTEEERAACTEELVALKEQIRLLHQETKELQGKTTWVNQWRTFTQEATLSASLLKSLREKLQEEGYQKEEQQLADWDRTVTPREWCKTRASAVQTLQQKAEEAKQLGVSYQKLCAGFGALEQQLTEADTRKQKIIDYLEKEKPLEETYRQIGLIESLTAQRKVLTEQQTQAGEMLEKQKVAQTQLQTLLDDQQKAVLQAHKACDNRQAELEKANAQLEALNYTQLLKEKNTLEQQRTSWKDYRGLVEKVLQAQQLAAEKKEALQGLQTTITKDYTQVAVFEEAERMLVEQTERQQQLYDKTRLACEDLMKETRSQLHEGDVCPLCGQRIAHLTTDEHFVSILQPVKKALDEITKKLQMSQKASSEQKALFKAHQQEEKRVSKEVQTAQSEERTCLENVQQHVLFTQAPLNEEVIQQIEHESEKLTQQLSILDTQLKEVGHQQETVSNLQKTKNQLDKELHELEDKAKLTEKQLADLKQKQAAQQSTLDGVQKSLAENTRQLSKQLDVNRFRHDGEAYVLALQKGAKLYQKAHDTLDEVEKKILNLSTERTHIRTLQESVLALHPEWNTLERLVPQSLEGLSGYWVTLQSRIAAHHEVSQQAKRQKQEAEQQLQQYFQSEGAITPEALQALLSLLANDMEQLRKSHQILRDEVLQAQTRMETAKKHLTEHEAQRPEMEEDITLETLSQQETQKISALEAANQQSGKVQQSLEQDDKNKQRFASICLELEQATQELDRWAHLSNLFGSAKGDKFRNIAQSYVLEQLLVNANQYLRQFTDRYEMECQPGSLTILLRDKEAGGVTRPTSTISGGESFLISLSLALGLSSLSRSSFSMDTLFIDEGFGTLDSSYLSTVIDALERLHQMDGKKIGIISHVESLKERLTTQIQVSRVNSTLSKVEVVSLI